MCSKMAEHAANQRDFERAIKLYKEALQHDPEDAPTLLALAKLYMQVLHASIDSLHTLVILICVCWCTSYFDYGIHLHLD